MKKVATILLLIVIITGCHHSNPTPPNAHTTPPPNTTSCATANENALIGKWNLKKKLDMEYTGPTSSHYYIHQDSVLYNNPAMAYVQFYSTPDTNKTGVYIVTGYKSGPIPSNSFPNSTTWTADQDTLVFLAPNSPPNNINSKWHIAYISTDSLVLDNKGWIGPPTVGISYSIWYFHK